MIEQIGSNSTWAGIAVLAGLFSAIPTLFRLLKWLYFLGSNGVKSARKRNAKSLARMIRIAKSSPTIFGFSYLFDLIFYGFIVTIQAISVSTTMEYGILSFIVSATLAFNLFTFIFLYRRLRIIFLRASIRSSKDALFAAQNALTHAKKLLSDVENHIARTTASADKSATLINDHSKGNSEQ